MPPKFRLSSLTESSWDFEVDSDSAQQIAACLARERTSRPYIHFKRSLLETFHSSLL